jgi:hypothetical protein
MMMSQTRSRSDAMAELPFCSHCFALGKPVIDYTSHFGYDHTFGRYPPKTTVSPLDSIDESNEESKDSDYFVDYTCDHFLNLPVEEQKTTLGESLYRAIAVTHPDLARETTNVILQIVTVPQLIRWIEHPDLMEEAIDQFIDRDNDDYDDE